MSTLPLIRESNGITVPAKYKHLRSVVLVIVFVLCFLGFKIYGSRNTSSFRMVDASSAENALDRPIVGILSLSFSREFMEEHQISMPSSAKGIIPSSYVKWLQSAGAQVVVIPHFWELEAIAGLVDKLSGVLFTGGDYGDSAWNRTTTMIFNEALARNGTDHPLLLWGTCLGFERIVQIASQDDVTAVVEARLIDESITVNWEKSLNSPFLRFMGEHALEAFASRPIAYNFHNYGVTPESWHSHAEKLDTLFNVVGMHKTTGDASQEFVAMIEGKHGLPVFGIQFHPEKALFEWSPNLHYPHSEIAVVNNRKIADFLVHQVRRIGNARFRDFQDESNFAIYNYQTIFTGISTNGGPIFTETYIIDK